MKQKNYCYLVGLLLLLLSLGACSQKKSQKEAGLHIVTSFYPIYSMVKEVSGDLNDVRMLLQSTMQISLSTIHEP